MWVPPEINPESKTLEPEGKNLHSGWICWPIFCRICKSVARDVNTLDSGPKPMSTVLEPFTKPVFKIRINSDSKPAKGFDLIMSSNY